MAEADPLRHDDDGAVECEDAVHDLQLLGGARGRRVYEEDDHVEAGQLAGDHGVHGVGVAPVRELVHELDGGLVEGDGGEADCVVEGEGHGEVREWGDGEGGAAAAGGRAY